jgi:PAP2 superfamily
VLAGDLAAWFFHERNGREKDVMDRRGMMLAMAVTLGCALVPRALSAAGSRPTPEQVLADWYRLVLELVRHTPTYTPPVASRAFAYLGVTGFEALASTDPGLLSLAGQLAELTPVPRAAEPLDPALVLHTALAQAVAAHFGNTGPTGQRAMAAMEARMGAQLTQGLEQGLIDASVRQAEAVALHVLAWSGTDGGAVVENMGFPMNWEKPDTPGSWVPTSLIVQQQAPLLPMWGDNRPFAMPSGDACGLPPPPAFSEVQGSPFHAEALEVFEISQRLSDEERAIARFWSDDPMLSPTPPGHWVSIALQVLEAEGADAGRQAEVLAVLGVALADAFIACWRTKFEVNLLRPVTYIRKHFDPKWESLLITPPFPEYPSGHSTQSAAAATVLTRFFGADHAFADRTHEADGLPARNYSGFHAAATEAGMSRLYGGIHFRSGILQGLEQGTCVGAYAARLRTRR